MFSPAELAAMHQFGVIPPVVTEQMQEYARIRHTLMFIREGVIMGSLWLVLHFGWAAALRDFGEARVRPAALRIVLYCTLLVAAIAVLRFPFNWYSGFHIEHQFGLSTQDFLSWFLDYLKTKALEIPTLAISFGAAFWSINRFPKSWAAVLWGVLTVLTAVIIFIVPILVDPLFNKVTPMPEQPLKTEIVRLAETAGAKDAPVFIADRSKQTKKLNAQVTGLGPSARVVLWDTSIQRLKQDELLSMIAHELGHYAHNHIMIGFGLVSIGLAFLMALCFNMKDRLLRLMPKRWRIQAITGLAAIPALLLIGAAGNFFLMPIENAISRAIETDADSFGLQLAGNPSAMARLFVVLSEQNLSDPDPPEIIEFWFYSHPSLRERIRHSLGIKP